MQLHERARTHLANPKELGGARDVQLVDREAVGDGHCAHSLIVDGHGAAGQAELLLQLCVLQEQRPGLWWRRLQCSQLISSGGYQRRHLTIWCIFDDMM